MPEKPPPGAEQLDIMQELSSIPSNMDPEVGLMHIEHKVRKPKAMHAYQSGKFPEAYETFLRLYEIEKVIYGEDHEDTVNTKMNIAIVLQNLQRPQESQKMMEEVVASLTESRGRQERQTRYARIIQANMLRDSGEEDLVKKGMKILLEVYIFEKSVKKQEERAFAIRSLVSGYEESKEYFKAYDFAEELHELHKGLHGKNHEKSLEARYLMASILFDLDRIDDCVKQFRKVLKRQIKHLGHKHPDTHRSQVRYLNILSATGRVEDTLDMYKELTHEDNKKDLKANMLEDAQGRLVHADDAATIGQYSKAYDLYTEVSEIQKEFLKESDKKAAETQHKRAMLLEKLGKYSQAIEILQKLIEIRSEILKPKAKELIQYKTDLAFVLNSQGRYFEAFEINQHLPKIAQREHHPLDIVTLNAEHNMILIWSSLGKVYSAFNLALDTAHSRKRTLHEDHEDTQETRLMIGVTLMLQNKPDRAKVYIEEVFERRHKALGGEHPSTLATERELALCLEAIGQRSKAFEMLQNVFNIQKRVLGEEIPDTFKTQIALASVSLKQGELKEAETLFKDVLEKQKKLFGGSHPGVSRAKFGLAALLEKRGNWQEAFKTHRKIFYERKQQFGDDNPLTLESKHEVTMVVVRAMRSDKTLIY